MMDKLLFGLTMALLYPLSYLPFGVLYFVSDLLFVLVYRVIGYRRKVVKANLANAFPDKSAKELATIERQFYRNLCDIVVENVKFLTISKTDIAARVKFINPEVIEAENGNPNSVIITLGHCGNWEMAGLAASFMLPYQSIAIYRTLKNPHFDGLMLNLRGRFGMELVPQNNTRNLLRQLRQPGRLFHFITDQTPGRTAANHWTIFLNQETPVFTGTEKVAQASNLPVWYAHILRTSRGHYSIELMPVSEQPKLEAEGFVTEKHTRLLQANIRQQPDNWLWSHRRWKHKRPEGMELYTPQVTIV